MHDLLPEAGRIEDVALFHAAQFLAALAGGFETDAADAADLFFGVGQLVDGDLLAVLFDGLMLAEVDAADELSDDDEVDALGNDLRPEGRSVGQLGPDLGGAVVGVNAHARSQAEQTLFRTLGAGNVVPLGAAHRAQQHGVGSGALVELMLGEGVTVLVDGAAAHIDIGVCKFVTELSGDLVEDQQGLIDDLRTDAVATDHGDGFFHISPPSGKPAGRPWR